MSVERAQRTLDRIALGVILTAVIILGTIFLLDYLSRDDASGGFVREGRESLAGPTAPSASPAGPAPSRTYKLPPDGQIMARAAFYDLSAGERAGMCAFFAKLPKDAVRQAVDAGIRPADARALVNFIVKELCP